MRPLGPARPSSPCLFSLAISKVTLDCQAGRCDLLGWVGIAVQVAITMVCAVAFVVVWRLESPRRPFATWAFDVSKQVVGSAYGKLYNIAQAITFAELLRHGADQQDQCVWYLMGIMVDCFVTTFLCWGANSLARPVLLRHYGVDIGDYEGHGSKAESGTGGGAAPSASAAAEVHMYLVQLTIWLLIITAVRLVVSVGLFFTQRAGYAFCAGIFEALGLHDPTSRLIFAVLVFPALADTFQIVVQDGFLKKPQEKASAAAGSQQQQQPAA